MMWSLFLLLSCIVYQSLTVSSAIPSSEDRYNFFNIDLLKEVLKENQQGNVIISPSSVKVALTTLIEGTHGPSREQILLTLRLPQEESLIRSICKDALKSLKSSKNGTEIDVVTRLWVGSNLKVFPYYADTIQQHYGTDLRSVDFTNLKNSTAIINEWGRLVTRNKVKSIVDSNNLSPSTRILLTSALYFKGKWLKSFDKKATQPRCFKIPSGECKKVYMMQNNDVYRYAYIPALDAEIVEIPYSDNKTSMLIMLPTREDTDKNLQIFSKDLSFITTSTLMNALQQTKIELSIPKFSVESKLDLRPALEEMGIRDIFDLNADLSGIAMEGGLRVGNILQNAKIEVDEDGTVAAAVTNIGVVPLMSSTLPNFKANRPFIYSIIDLETNRILFAGRYMEPTVHDLVSPLS